MQNGFNVLYILARPTGDNDMVILEPDQQDPLWKEFSSFPQLAPDMKTSNKNNVHSQVNSSDSVPPFKKLKSGAALQDSVKDNKLQDMVDVDLSRESIDAVQVQ